MSQTPTDTDRGARMPRVTIVRDGADAGEATFRAIVGSTQAAGRTAGEAVDALAARLPEDEGGTLLIVRDLRPDRFFTEEQRRRLEELTNCQRATRDAGGELPAEELDELQRLVDAEVEATAQRADAAGFAQEPVFGQEFLGKLVSFCSEQ